MTGPNDARRFAVAHELADERNQKRTQTNQPSHELRIADELGIAHEKHLMPYKDQILDLAMHGSAFHAKAKADPAFRQAATKDAAALRHTTIKVNAELVA